jgi:hypothetical protein
MWEAGRRRICSIRITFINEVGFARAMALVEQSTGSELENILKHIKMRKELDDEEIGQIGAKYDSSGRNGISMVTIFNSGAYINRLWSNLYLKRLNLGLSPMLKGENILIIGPGSGIHNDARWFLDCFPAVREVHVVDACDEVFIGVDSSLRYVETKLPDIFGYKINALELPEELEGKMGVVIDGSVVDRRFEERVCLQHGLQVQNVLKKGGLHLFIPADGHVKVHSDESHMKLIDLSRSDRNYSYFVKC